MPASPRVSVIMPVYNGEEHVSRAIESILGQKLRNFELLIIDDGSDDDSAKIVNSYDDPRIRFIRNELNSGLSVSLNKGLACAMGEFVARMDQDDISVPERLAKQVAFLDENPEIGVAGSACEEIDTSDRICGARTTPVSDLEIRWTSLLASPFLHPTVVMRRKLLMAHGLRYDERCLAAEDYDLWTRMLRVTRGANLNEPLLRYRLGHGMTKMRRAIQLEEHDDISFRTIKEYLPDLAITHDDVSQLRALLVGGEDAPPDNARRAELFQQYLEMLSAFAEAHAGERGLSAWRRAEGLRMVRKMHAVSLPIEAFGLAWRLIRIDPGVLFLAAHRFIRQLAMGGKRNGNVDSREDLKEPR